MVVFPRGLARKYLSRDCALAFCLWVDDARLTALVAHAALHHEDETDDELFARCLYRYAHKYPWSWRLPLLIAIAAISLFVWSVA